MLGFLVDCNVCTKVSPHTNFEFAEIKENRLNLMNFLAPDVKKCGDIWK